MTIVLTTVQCPSETTEN